MPHRRFRACRPNRPTRAQQTRAFVCSAISDPVTARGSVQLFYQGRILQADRVVYTRSTKHVYAEGHAKMTDEHGDVVYGDRFELSDNFRDGFIDSVQVLTSDKTRFTSPRKTPRFLPKRAWTSAWLFVPPNQPV